MFRNCLSKSRFYLKKTISVKASCTLFLSIKKGHFISIEKNHSIKKYHIFEKKNSLKNGSFQIIMIIIIIIHTLDF